MTQHQDLGGYFLSSLRKASVPSRSSSVSNPLFPHFARPQGKWPQMKIYMLALQMALCISSRLSLAESSPAIFRSWMLSVYLSGSGALGWGAQIGV